MYTKNFLRLATFFSSRSFKMGSSQDASKKIIFQKSGKLPDSVNREIKGYDFNKGPLSSCDLKEIFMNTGFQATSVGLAIDEINRMLDAKDKFNKKYRNLDKTFDFFEYGTYKREKSGCTIFLGYTSNMISCGLRDVIRYLTEHNMVDCIVTTAGGVEEDFIKCLAPTYLGDFNLDGASLRKESINRIGNLLMPNDNYCRFEQWLSPILQQMLKEQNEQVPAQMDFLIESRN